MRNRARTRVGVSVLSALTLSLASLAVAGSTVAAKSVRSYTNETWYSDVSWWSVPSWNASTKVPVYKAITNSTGLTFTTDVPPVNADSKLSLMLTTGKLPAIITLQDPTEAEQLIQSGKVWNLQQFFQRYDPSFLKSFPKGLISEQRIELGGFYGIPDGGTAPDMFTGKYKRFKAQALYPTNAQIVFNVPLMHKTGITLKDVRTEAGLIRSLKKVASMHLKVGGAPVIPLQVDTSINWPGETLNSLAQMFGAMPVTKQGNYRPLRLSPEMKTTIQFFHTLAADNVLTRDEFTLDTTADNAAVTSGRVFCFLGNTGNPQWETMWSQNHEETWVSPGNVLSATGLKPTWGYSYGATGWTYTLVSKNAPNPAKVAQFLAFMYGPKGQLLINYGIKGPDWHWGPDHRVVQNPKVVNDLNSQPNYWLKSGIGDFWFFGNTPYDLSVQPPVKTMPGTMENAMKLARTAIKPVYLYDATALNIPSTVIAPGSPQYQEQQQINQYWPEQVLKMIFASSAKQENSLYVQTIQKMKQMGLTSIDATINKVFHKQEREYHDFIKGINP